MQSLPRKRRNKAAGTFGFRFFASGGRESFPRSNPRLEDRRRVIGRLKTQGATPERTNLMARKKGRKGKGRKHGRK